MAERVQNKRNIAEVFMDGAKRGFYIGAEKVAPAMVMAFAIIQFLQITGLMDILGKVLGPVMGIFGLPGQAIVALIAAFFAKTAGAAAAAMLYSNGVIDAAQATILFPATITMGTLIGHFVRIVIVANAKSKWHPLLMGICLVDAAITMFIVRGILMFM